MNGKASKRPRSLSRETDRNRRHRNHDRAGDQSPASIYGMTPRNESIRRSITTETAFSETQPLSSDPINIPYRRDNNLLPCPLSLVPVFHRTIEAPRKNTALLSATKRQNSPLLSSDVFTTFPKNKLRDATRRNARGTNLFGKTPGLFS